MPSPCAPLTSAPCLSSARSASRSPFIAASATGELEAAARIADSPTAIAALETSRCFMMVLARVATLKGSRYVVPSPLVPKSPTARQLAPSPSPYTSSDRERELPCAVPERLHVIEPELMQERQHDVRHRRAVGRLQVQVPLQPAVGVPE